MRQWDLHSKICFRIQGRCPHSTCLTTTMNSNWLLFGDCAGLLLWNMATGQHRPVQAAIQDGECLAFTPDGNCSVWGSNDYSMKLWCFEPLQRQVLQFRGHTNDVKACVVSPDGSRLYSGCQLTVSHFRSYQSCVERLAAGIRQF